MECSLYLNEFSPRVRRWNPMLTPVLNIIVLFPLCHLAGAHMVQRVLVGKRSQCTRTRIVWCHQKELLAMFCTGGQWLVWSFPVKSALWCILILDFSVGSSKDWTFHFHIPSWLLSPRLASLTPLLVLPEAILSVNCLNINPRLRMKYLTLSWVNKDAVFYLLPSVAVPVPSGE